MNDTHKIIAIILSGLICAIGGGYIGYITGEDVATKSVNFIPNDRYGSAFSHGLYGLLLGICIPIGIMISNSKNEDN